MYRPLVKRKGKQATNPMRYFFKGLPPPPPENCSMCKVLLCGDEDKGEGVGQNVTGKGTPCKERYENQVLKSGEGSEENVKKAKFFTSECHLLIRCGNFFKLQR